MEANSEYECVGSYGTWGKTQFHASAHATLSHLILPHLPPPVLFIAMPQLAVDAAPPRVDLAIRRRGHRMSPATRKACNLAAAGHRNGRWRHAVLRITKAKLPKLQRVQQQQLRGTPVRIRLCSLFISAS